MDNIVLKIYEQIESHLSDKLKKKGFEVHERKIQNQAFGSGYTIWKNDKDYEAIRLIWDGKGSWFIVEESPFKGKNEPNSWADIVIVPYDARITDSQYEQEIIDAVVTEIE